MRPIVDGSIVVSLEQTRQALRMLAEKTRLIAEGAGALALATELTGKAGSGPIVAALSHIAGDCGRRSSLVRSAVP